MQENLENLARVVFSLNLHAAKLMKLSRGILGSNGPTELVHLSKFAEFRKETNGIVPYVEKW